MTFAHKSVTQALVLHHNLVGDGVISSDDSDDERREDGDEVQDGRTAFWSVYDRLLGVPESMVVVQTLTLGQFLPPRK